MKVKYPQGWPGAPAGQLEALVVELGNQRPSRLDPTELTDGSSRKCTPGGPMWCFVVASPTTPRGTGNPPYPPAVPISYDGWEGMGAGGWGKAHVDSTGVLCGPDRTAQTQTVRGLNQQPSHVDGTITT
ncbi:unnamed protein product [Arctogadus glacialis]